MDAREAIQQLKSELVLLKDRGQDHVTIVGLEKYLVGLEKAATTSAELRSHAHQSSLAQYDAQANSALEMFKSVLESGREAIRAVLLINGGAAVALLGALSYVVPRNGLEQLGLGVSTSLAAFGSGVFLGALSSGARYVTQFTYMDGHSKTGHSFNALSVLFTVAAYVAFGVGLFHAHHALIAHFAPR